MINVEEIIASISGSYSEVSDELFKKINILVGLICAYSVSGVTRDCMAQIIAKYAGIDSYDLFLRASCIRTTRENVIPISTEYNISIYSSASETQIVVYDRDMMHRYTENPKPICNKYCNIYHYNSRNFYDFVIQNDSFAIGAILADKSMMNKPCWKTEEKIAVGIACISEMTKKMKLSLWRFMEYDFDSRDKSARMREIFHPVQK